MIPTLEMPPTQLSGMTWSERVLMLDDSSQRPSYTRAREGGAMVCRYWSCGLLGQICGQVTQKANDIQRPPPGRPPMEHQHIHSAPTGLIQLIHECWAQVCVGYFQLGVALGPTDPRCRFLACSYRGRCCVLACAFPARRPCDAIRLCSWRLITDVIMYALFFVLVVGGWAYGGRAPTTGRAPMPWCCRSSESSTRTCPFRISPPLSRLN